MVFGSAPGMDLFGFQPNSVVGRPANNKTTSPAPSRKELVMQALQDQMQSLQDQIPHDQDPARAAQDNQQLAAYQALLQKVQDGTADGTEPENSGMVNEAIVNEVARLDLRAMQEEKTNPNAYQADRQKIKAYGQIDPNAALSDNPSDILKYTMSVDQFNKMVQNSGRIF